MAQRGRDAGAQPIGRRTVDEQCELASTGKVYGDYSCMLNQTNIKQNENKFYVIQVIEDNKMFYSWNRWGRVGEVGRNKLSPFDTPEKAVANFEEKFKDKTRNDWSNRSNFVTYPGKYTLIEVEGVQDNEVLDIEKMPLGKLSKVQIAKGLEVLEEIEAALNEPNQNHRLEELSSKFFTTIPHNFDRNRPPTINTNEIIEQKREMLMVLDSENSEDSEESETERAQEETIETVPQQLDQD